MSVILRQRETGDARIDSIVRAIQTITKTLSFPTDTDVRDRAIENVWDSFFRDEAPEEITALKDRTKPVIDLAFALPLAANEN